MHAQTISPDRLIELGSAYRKAKALLSAVELDLFSVLARGPLDADKLRMALDLHSRSAGDFFDTLVALGLLVRGDDGRYANASDCDLYLNRESPSFLGGMFAQLNIREYRMCVVNAHRRVAHRQAAERVRWRRSFSYDL
jgi:hypothetical protein